MTDEFAGRYGRWALIAGASEGVGACLADQLAARGLDLVLIARNGPLLEKVAAGVRDRHGVTVRPLTLDLTDPEIGVRMADATAGLEVGLVIYNAGAANRTNEFIEDDLEFSLHQIKLACIGPITLARQLAPAMRDRGRSPRVCGRNCARTASTCVARRSARPIPRGCSGWASSMTRIAT